MSRIRHVVWDWNGTLLDDVDAAFGTINQVLGEYELDLLADLAAYRRVFTFPISSYYERIGLGLSTGLFDRAAHRYMAIWAELSVHAQLRSGAREALAGVQRRGLGQAVVSASHTENLARQMAPFELDGYLDAALGIGDIYAASKAHVARSWLESLTGRGIAAHEVLFVGDTAHDAEIAEELGAQIALVSGGHMEVTEAAARGVRILDTPGDVLALLDAPGRSGDRAGA